MNIIIYCKNPGTGVMLEEIYTEREACLAYARRLDFEVSGFFDRNGNNIEGLAEYIENIPSPISGILFCNTTFASATIGSYYVVTRSVFDVQARLLQGDHTNQEVAQMVRRLSNVLLVPSKEESMLA